MFEQCDDAFIKAIVLQLRLQVLLAGDSVFKAHEAGTEMYFIMRGEMKMMDESLTVCYNTLYSGAYFGELAMLTGQPRTATAHAVTDCVLFYINQYEFERIARKWPKAFATILAKAKERLERVASTNTMALAEQLGDKLSEMKKELKEDAGGIIGFSPTKIHTALAPAPAAGAIDCASTPQHQQENPTEGILFGPQTGIGRGISRGQNSGDEGSHWRAHVESELRSMRQLQQTLLERLDSQTELFRKFVSSQAAACRVEGEARASTPRDAKAEPANRPGAIDPQAQGTESLPPLAA